VFQRKPEDLLHGPLTAAFGMFEMLVIVPLSLVGVVQLLEILVVVM
jgi:hypothetical protein